MTAHIIDGKAIALELRRSVAQRAGALAERTVLPGLTFILIGISPPAELYADRLEKLAGGAGIHFARHRLPEDIEAEDLEWEVVALNADAAVDGILIQMPLPEHLAHARLFTLMDPRKDVDGITVQNAGRLYLGIHGQAPSTALAMMHILSACRIDPLGKHAVVVGRSNVVGHPVSELLLHRDATVTVTHRQTVDLAGYTREADILMVAAGDAGLIRPDMIKPGVVIVDAGINVTEHGVVGDVEFDGCAQIAAAITPVPGGVGPVTNAVLLRSVLSSAERRSA